MYFHTDTKKWFFGLLATSSNLAALQPENAVLRSGAFCPGEQLTKCIRNYRLNEGSSFPRRSSFHRLAVAGGKRIWYLHCPNEGSLANDMVRLDVAARLAEHLGEENLTMRELEVLELTRDGYRN